MKMYCLTCKKNIVNKILNIRKSRIDQCFEQVVLKQPVFAYSACGPFTKYCETIQKFRKTGI